MNNDKETKNEAELHNALRHITLHKITHLRNDTNVTNTSHSGRKR
jgi:hypothetical protein